jgi:hypothetical protein
MHGDCPTRILALQEKLPQKLRAIPCYMGEYKEAIDFDCVEIPLYQLS